MRVFPNFAVLVRQLSLQTHVIFLDANMNVKAADAASLLLLGLRAKELADAAVPLGDFVLAWGKQLPLLQAAQGQGQGLRRTTDGRSGATGAPGTGSSAGIIIRIRSCHTPGADEEDSDGGDDDSSGGEDGGSGVYRDRAGWVVPASSPTNVPRLPLASVGSGGRSGEW